MNTTTVVQDIEALLADSTETGGSPAALIEARKMWHDICHDREKDANVLVHIATLLGLGFHRVLALLLKYKSECVLIQAIADPLTIANKRLVPDSGMLFQILSMYSHVPNGLAYDPQSLADTIRELILIDGHVIANNSPELRAFAERSRHSLELWQRSSHDIQEVYHDKKGQWLDLQDQLGEQLLFVETRRLANEALNQRWLAIFGEAYIVFQEQETRFEGLRRRIELKLAHSEISPEALEQLVREVESAQNAKVRTLRSRLALASLGITQHAGDVISPEEASEFRRQCKTLLRNIWLLLHPDSLTQHPQYAQLTDRQKTQLTDLWHRAMVVKECELGFEPGCIGYDHRSLVILHDILSSVKGILAESGIDTDVHLIITGETAEEQISWLERSIQRLEDELDAVHAELIALLNDPDIHRRAKDLKASPSEQEDVKQEMLAQARDCRDQAERMEAHLNHLFTNQDSQA